VPLLQMASLFLHKNFVPLEDTFSAV
jgi:hypothetical protein